VKTPGSSRSPTVIARQRGPRKTPLDEHAPATISKHTIFKCFTSCPSFKERDQEAALQTAEHDKKKKRE
jgi:hypothetical protein